MSRALLCAAGLWVVLAAGDARAHTRSQSFSSWSLHGSDLAVVYTVASAEATRLAAADDPSLPLDALLADELGQTVHARAGERPCERIAGPTPLAATPGHLRAELRFRCASDRPLVLEIGAFFALAPSHVHFARLAVEGAPPVELLFTERAQERLAHAAPGAPPTSAAFLGYARLGIEHIALGPDHLAFLLALLLFASRTREVVVLVTGFTLGHSLTLALGALGLARPEPALVEVLIGFTIALVAAENVGSANGDQARISSGAALALAGLALIALWTQRGPPPALLLGLAFFTGCYGRLASTADAARRLRPGLTVLFGLVHGFGFAGVLLEIGLPRDRLLAALFGFNLGVELGQLAFVAAFALAAAGILRLTPGRIGTLGRDAASAALCGLGVYWFIQRGYALLSP